MPQGAQNSPTQFAKAMATILSAWQEENTDITLLQYVDDLLLCADDLPTTKGKSERLLVFLAGQGCKASKQELQWCSMKVVFLGHCLSQGSRHLTSDRVQAVKNIPLPQGSKSLHAFLGLISYLL